MTNKILVRVRVGVRAWIKIYIRHTENTELLPYITDLSTKIRVNSAPSSKSRTIAAKLDRVNWLH